MTISLPLTQASHLSRSALLRLGCQPGDAPAGADRIVRTRDSAASAHLDARDAIGYLAAREAADLAIAKALHGGIAAVAASGTWYTGMLSYSAERAAAAGLVVMIASNASPTGADAVRPLEERKAQTARRRRHRCRSDRRRAPCPACGRPWLGHPRVGMLTSIPPGRSPPRSRSRGVVWMVQMASDVRMSRADVTHRLPTDTGSVWIEES